MCQAMLQCTVRDGILVCNHSLLKACARITSMHIQKHVVCNVCFTVGLHGFVRISYLKAPNR